MAGEGWADGGAAAAGVGAEIEVFVRGLPWSTTESELQEFLTAGGCHSITNVKIPTRADGKSSGTAYVKFSDEAGQQAALALDGQELGGRWLGIRVPRTRNGGGGGFGGGNGGNGGGNGGNAGGALSSQFEVLVRGLPWATTESELQDFLTAGGCLSITNVKIPTRADGTSTGKAFVKFSDEAGVTAATALSGQELGGRSLSIGPTRASRKTGVKPEGGTTTIYIGNLSWSITEEEVAAFFSGCGTVTRVRFATYADTGRMRGFGHVEFAEPEATDAAVQLAGVELAGRELRVDYAEALGRRR